MVRLHAASVGGTSSIPVWGTKIPHATWLKDFKKEEEEKNKQTNIRNETDGIPLQILEIYQGQ